MEIWTAPYPEELAALVTSVSYKDWTFRLARINEYDAEGLHLILGGRVQDAYVEEESLVAIEFPFVVPAQTRTREGWVEWLFECVLKAERHEAGEHFVIDGQRPYAPGHVPNSEGFRNALL